MELPSWEVKGDEPSRASTGRLLLPLQPRQAASLLGSVGSHACNRRFWTIFCSKNVHFMWFSVIVEHCGAQWDELGPRSRGLTFIEDTHNVLGMLTTPTPTPTYLELLREYKSHSSLSVSLFPAEYVASFACLVASCVQLFCDPTDRL